MHLRPCQVFINHRHTTATPAACASIVLRLVRRKYVCTAGLRLLRQYDTHVSHIYIYV
ncbi:unnamed protein product [Chondrus crispus]|uniref:Uncharacterized protein n=1 Tax=Chondrus crispus TaxID=2769 RepID=R7QPA2_CHOCR|nr:unnamed protein product [Chondrus crispus]CDF39220.1 unnamed protein product [Chondrus crispus]|eukprot:XP_005719131.1 unnamed protein product [Chondrus crispus]